MKKRIKRSTPGIVVVLVCALAAYFLYSVFFPSGFGTPPHGVHHEPPRSAPLGSREYRDFAHQFSLFYPEALTVQEIDEAGGGSTILFQNPEAGVGFQIFIVGYSEPVVTEERFKKDIPSGVQTNKEDIIVDGAKGVAFYSLDLGLGETREAWFIKNGFLYEVTTPKPLEAHLLEVLKSWKFIL